jgi:hypothetical protein
MPPATDGTVRRAQSGQGHDFGGANGRWRRTPDGQFVACRHSMVLRKPARSMALRCAHRASNGDRRGQAITDDRRRRTHAAFSLEGQRSFVPAVPAAVGTIEHDPALALTLVLREPPENREQRELPRRSG